MNKILIAVVVLAVLLGGTYSVVKTSNINTSPTNEINGNADSIPGVTTTTTVTPGTTYTGTITGNVVLGPTCPVQKIPPDPNCTDKPYQTSIDITETKNGSTYVVATDSGGNFTTQLTPGTYTIKPRSGGIKFQSCQSQSVTVVAGETKNIALSCDTGIR